LAIHSPPALVPAAPTTTLATVRPSALRSPAGSTTSSSLTSHTNPTTVWITCWRTTALTTSLGVTRFLVLTSSGSWMRCRSSGSQLSESRRWKKSEKAQ